MDKEWLPYDPAFDLNGDGKLDFIEHTERMEYLERLSEEGRPGPRSDSDLDPDADSDFDPYEGDDPDEFDGLDETDEYDGDDDTDDFDDGDEYGDGYDEF